MLNDSVEAEPSHVFAATQSYKSTLRADIKISFLMSGLLKRFQTLTLLALTSSYRQSGKTCLGKTKCAAIRHLR